MRTLLLYVLFLLSGAAGLVYELVWVRELIFVFGGTTYAITTVLVAFMAGLGLGSFVAGRWCYRLQRPGRVYGLLEIGIGAYALAVPLLLGVTEPAYGALYPHLVASPWLLSVSRFLLSGLVLLVPTTCMGATLPVLVRYVTLQGRALGRSVGHLYGINTLGAVVGVVSAGFWLIPTLGLTHTTWLAAAGNFLIGITALVFLGGKKGSGPFSATRSSGKRLGHAEKGPDPFLPRRVLLIGFALSGFAAMVYQITWTRALIMSLGCSTYAFTCILAAFILGLAVGSLVIARWVDRWEHPVLVFGGLELIIGLVAVLIVPIHGWVPVIARSLVASHYTDYSVLWGWQFLLIIAITFVPTFLMGAIFPLVTRALAAEGDEPGAVTGRAYAVNTLGTITGSFLAGFVLIRSDVLGVQNSIIFASLLNGVVGMTLIVLGRPPSRGPLLRRTLIPAAGLLLIPLVAVGTGRWDPRVLATAPYLHRDVGSAVRLEQEVVYFAEGVDVTVTVHQALAEPDSLTLTVNGKPEASTGLEDMVSQLLMGHLPALIAPEGKTACMIGLGSGMTLGALACHPSYERFDCIEISDEVIKAAAYFAPYTCNVLTDDPRVRTIRADGRNHLLLTDRVYDLIVSQPSNPWMSGISNLFTREFFELGKRRLADDGLLAVWLHGYSMSVHDFQMVVRTLFEVFDSVSLWELHENDYLMLASRRPQRIGLDEFIRRFETPTVRADLYRVNIRRPGQLLGQYIASDSPLRAWAAAAPVHTDDNALLEFSAPRYLYLGEQIELARAFLELQRPVLDDLLPSCVGSASETPADEISRVVAARSARVRAAEAARDRDVARALELLLESYQLDPSHTHTYVQLVRFREHLWKEWPQLAVKPQIGALLAQVGRLRPPPAPPRRGATLADIAADEMLRPLRDEPGFKALLDQADTKPP